jgi:PIN domain nuclease of toxin-antitoxin system
VGYRVTSVLLDTHALVWWLEAKDRLSPKAQSVISDSETTVLVSSASAWELAIKSQLGKFKSRELVDELDKEIQKEGFVELPISIEHALRAGSLPGRHKDPFDRMLISQALIEEVALVSADRYFDGYAIARIW